MPLDDESRVKNPLRKDSVPPDHIKSSQNFLQHNTPDFVSSQEWTPHSTNLNPLHYSVWDSLQQLVYEGRCELFANLKRSSECYQRQMA